MEMLKIIATGNDAGRTIFKFLIKTLDNLPISAIEKLLRKKEVKFNGQRKFDKNTIIQENDEIIIYGVTDTHKKTTFVNAEIFFKTIYEDENILIINKKENQVVHSEENCLDAQVLSYLKYRKIDSFTPSHIGRLDKVTSGIMIYAKNYATLSALKFAQNDFEKYYIFRNAMPEQELVVNYEIAKDEENKRMKIDPQKGKSSKTRFFFENGKKYAQIYTGRKHQIRVSLSKLGFPIDGDRKYGGKKALRVYLHSYRIVFRKLTGHLEYLNNKEFISLPKW